MSESEIKQIADQAQMVVGGYSFTKKENVIFILNLEHPDRAMTISPKGKMLETNMDPIEQVLVLKYWEKNASFMEDCDA